MTDLGVNLLDFAPCKIGVKDLWPTDIYRDLFFVVVISVCLFVVRGGIVDNLRTHHMTNHITRKEGVCVCLGVCYKFVHFY